jgi:hypothetical protein
MAARNGKAKLAVLEKADASPATLPDLQAKDRKSKKLEWRNRRRRSRYGSATV